MSKHVIETVTFKLNDGNSRADFIAAAGQMNAWVKEQSGFIQRRLSCSDDGTWIEQIEWKNMDAAKAAAAAAASAPANANFMSGIDFPTVQLTHSELEVVIN